MDRFHERTTFEETEQPENEVTAMDLAAQDAEELAIFGPACTVRQSLIAASDTINTMRVLLRVHEAECDRCGATKTSTEFDRKLWLPRFGPRIANPEGVCCVRQVA